MTLPEVILWQRLRNRALDGLHFRHQHPVGPYILDFYCSSAHLCVEIDGQQHGTDEAAHYDEARTVWLGGQGIRVLRFAAVHVLRDEHLVGVLEMIRQAAAPSTA
jgi:very-short-patch-repair endonuclease